ncbi:MAG TPA: hypothetical protein DEA82_16950 [Flavobacteriaceae bacterium]|nr:hypothetical protein [Flavobacteriaceae bacterium]MAY53934.1 hypothetical protein [Flavobacteriaceae bacterium]HBR55775.1 hypothetical protein [Flavobacteriaceae bacterium]
MVYGNEQTLYIKPVFHIVLFLWYFSVKKKIDVKLVFFLGFALTAEFLTAIDFDGYYTLINILFACYFFVGLWCMKPVLQQSKFTLRGQEVFFGLLITGVLLYMVYGLIYYSIQEFQENVPTVLGGISFLLFTGGCFYVTLFHSHPKKFYLFVVGSCYFVVCLGYMVYQLLLLSDLLMGLVNTAEIIAQFYFVLFMIHKQEMLSKTKWYI